MSEPTLDKKLEGRIFDLLENRARLPLGQIVQLRRRSRAAKISLIDAALQAERITRAQAAAISNEVGLGDARYEPADPRGETGDLPVAAPPRAQARPPAAPPPPPLPNLPPDESLEALESVESIDTGLHDAMDDFEPLVAPTLRGRPAIPNPLATLNVGPPKDLPVADSDDPFDFSDLESELADLRVSEPPPALPAESTDANALGDDSEPGDMSVELAPMHEDAGEPIVDSEALALLAEHEAEQAQRAELEGKAPGADPDTTGSTVALDVEDGSSTKTQIGKSKRDTPVHGDTSPPSPKGGSVNEPVADIPVAGRRYALGRELGRGGMGQVLEARDLALERSVALKLLIDQDDPALRVRFMDEARVTGQLQHPSVPAVYELGKLGDGRLFFAMRRIEGRTLRDILEDLKFGDAEVEKHFGRVRLLTLMSQVCRTIAYAHSRGVIHRDLKPDNIMLGEFGEVTVMDWGLAKPVGTAGGRPDVSTARQTDGGRFSTQHGEVTGTPQYMPPEQAMGNLEELGSHSDNYSLGAMLYEILTLEPPFDGPSARAIRDAVINARVIPPSERNPDRPVPHSIEQLCLQCLAKDPRSRPKSALNIAEQIDRYLEGEQDRARKEGERRKLHELGKAAAEHWFEGYAHLKQLHTRTAQMRARIEPWASTEARDPLWKLEDEEQKARMESARHLSEALAHYHGALGVAGDNETTRHALAELYYSAFEAAERDQDAVHVAHYENLVRAFDGEGHFKARLKGDGRLEMETLPKGLQGTLYQMRVVDRVLTPTAPQSLGQMPVKLDPLPMGSYLIKLQAPGLSEAVVPIFISRQESVRLRIRIFPDAAVGKGMVHVSGGPARVGGDNMAQLATPARTLEVPDFFISRKQVTCSEYLDFLRGIGQAEGARVALMRAPRTAHGGAILWPAGPDGMPQMPERDATGQPWHPDWPVVCISCEDAEAYCAWRHQITGQRHRLPSEVEWEKAARGADGRLFPWGDDFEATFCHMGISRPGAPARGPGGQFPVDRSPYGIEDLAGGASEWTSSWLDEGARQRIIKGGSWASSPTECRAASRFTQAVTAVLPTLGFRLARDAPA